jgi:hypothetical protein
MKIALDYRNPTPSHCEVAVLINGTLAGVLTIRQEDVDVFEDVIKTGLHLPGDSFSARGDPGEIASARMFARDFPGEQAEES